jgi:hypothetical protein
MARPGSYDRAVKRARRALLQVEIDEVQAAMAKATAQGKRRESIALGVRLAELKKQHHDLRIRRRKKKDLVDQVADALGF